MNKNNNELRDKQIIELTNRLVPQKEIAQRFGLSDRRIREILSNNNVKTNYNGTKTTRNAEVIKASKTMTYSEIAKKFGITTERVKKILQTAISSKDRQSSGFDKRQKFAAETLRSEHNKVKTDLRKAITELQRLDRVVNAIVPIAETKRQQITISKSKPSGTTEAIACSILSDIHYEEIVSPEKVNYLNEYNPIIAEERLMRYFKGFVRLIEIERHGVKIKKATLWILGDLITGYLRDENRKNNAMSPTSAIIRLLDILYNGIVYIANKSGILELDIIFQCGNHGRTTEKIEHSVFVENSYEWLLYMVLARDLKKHKNIKVHIPTSIHFYTDIFDKKIRSMHGHEINYNGGIGDLDVPLRKAIANLDTAIRADITVLAHWHRLKHDMDFIVNGSIIGHNPYAIAKKIKYVKPMQAFFLIDNKRGLQDTRPIYV